MAQSMSAAGDFQSLCNHNSIFLDTKGQHCWGEAWTWRLVAPSDRSAIVSVSFFCTLEAPALKQSETDLMLPVSFMDGFCSAWRLTVSCLEAVAGRWHCYGPFDAAHSLSSLTSR